MPSSFTSFDGRYFQAVDDTGAPVTDEYGRGEFTGTIDKVEVKRLAELSPREIEHDNPEVRRPEEMSHFLSQLYNREVTDDDTVTVIRFSAIKR